LLHGIGWTPDQKEVWESSSGNDPTLKSGRGSHWLTFDATGDHGYVAPGKSSSDGTEIFDPHTHTSLGVIGSTEDMIAIEFVDGKISRVGDQFGIGRR
jgi:hypothetical protein